MTARVKRLIDAVGRLEAFLIDKDRGHWAQLLADVKRGLENEETRESHRTELDSYFGGMGSLNDLGFQDESDNKQFGRLADIVFRENRLVNARLSERVRWRLLESAKQDELPPRIKNGFALTQPYAKHHCPRPHQRT